MEQPLHSSQLSRGRLYLEMKTIHGYDVVGAGVVVVDVVGACVGAVAQARMCAQCAFHSSKSERLNPPTIPLVGM